MLLPPGPSPRPRPGSSDAQATRSDRVGRARHGVAIPARLAATAAALAALLASPARAQTVNPDLFITNGQITAQALRDSTLYIGTWNMADRFLLGEIDDFAIWGRALRPTEVAAISRKSPGF